MDYVRLGENIMKKDSICQVNIINQQNVTTAMNYLEKEKVQKSLRILKKFTDNKQINIIFYLLAVEELCVFWGSASEADDSEVENKGLNLYVSLKL